MDEAYPGMLALGFVIFMFILHSCTGLDSPFTQMSVVESQHGSCQFMTIPHSGNIQHPLTC